MATEPSAAVRGAAALLGALVAPLVLAGLESTAVDGVGGIAAGSAALSAVAIGALPGLLYLASRVAPTWLFERSVRLAVALQASLTAAFAGALLVRLTDDPVIGYHPAVLAGLCAMVVAAAIEVTIRRPALHWAAGTAGLLGACAAWIANYRIAPGNYPEFHWAVTNLTLVAAGLAVSHLTLAVLDRLSAGRRLWLLAIAGVCTLVGLGLGFAVQTEAAARNVAADTEVGRAALLVKGDHPVIGKIAGVSPPTRPLDEDYFARARPFDLPEGFALDDWDVLFVASEAIRWDDTSLEKPALKTTPSLIEWRKRGAMEFKQAYAPSSGTLQSLTSWFTMQPPSCAELDIYKPQWAGKLRDEAVTAAEIFADSGRHTFWIGHNFRGTFERKMFGFEQGFEHVQRTYEYDRSDAFSADDETGDAAVAYLRGLPRDERFFGYVMFSSPHFRYVKHYDDMPGKSSRQRYRQEIRKADEQFGKLFTALEETGRLDHTIVILTADHGEEFREHGATGHNSSVFDESVRVPLLVWLPGATARRATLPTATGWILPWLMLHGAPDVQRRTREAVDHGWAPMLAATSGAVAVELLRGERSRTALVLPKTKLVLDVVPNRGVAYDLDKDPREREKRFDLTPVEQDALDGYLAARRRCERVVDTKKRPPNIPLRAAPDDKDRP